MYFGTTPNLIPFLMKKVVFKIILGSALVFSCWLGSCSQPTEKPQNDISQTEKPKLNQIENSEQETEWKEMEDYHFLMAETFHPAEEKDFEPIRTKAEELAKSAETWQNAIPPPAFDRPEIKEKIALLAQESRELANFIQTKPTDEVLFKKLNALHDRFHEVMGTCQHNEHDKHEQHKH